MSPEDIDQIEERFNKSKSVHSIMRNLATTQKRVSDTVLYGVIFYDT